MQIKWIGLNTVKLVVSTYLWLPLIEIALSPGLTIELFNIIGLSIEQIAMVCFLVWGSETAKYQNMLAGNLEQAAALQAYPISIFFYL